MTCSSVALPADLSAYPGIVGVSDSCTQSIPACQERHSCKGSVRAPVPVAVEHKLQMRQQQRRCSLWHSARGVLSAWRQAGTSSCSPDLGCCLLQDAWLAGAPRTAALPRGRALLCQRPAMRHESIGGSRPAACGVHSTGRASGRSHHRLSPEWQVWAGAGHREGREAQLFCHRLEVHCIPSMSHLHFSSSGCHNSAAGPALCLRHASHCNGRVILLMLCKTPMQWENILSEASGSGICAAWRRL